MEKLQEIIERIADARSYVQYEKLMDEMEEHKQGQPFSLDNFTVLEMQYHAAVSRLKFLEEEEEITDYKGLYEIYLEHYAQV